MRPIKQILVANRGEIAIRIFRACTELGIGTSAIYSYEDRLSIHRYKADRAFLVGVQGKPVAAYLDGDAIIALALRKGIDAIHPGYGFLSENAEFARKCEAAGLIWIGPPADVMEALGDKVKARKVAVAAGVPVVPGSDDPIGSLAEAIGFTKQFGFPVFIKAAHGGGGRGMRIARDAGELPDAFELARSESLTAFGSDEVFIERFIANPRHIEVQIVADQHGGRVHFHERDCSIQRRHQKVIELAPSPRLHDSVREQLFAYALLIAEAADYQNVGTVEFLVEDQDDGCHVYFIEVNTRIQVEHTVTEMVTGYDLIKTMIRVAEGYPLSAPEIGISGQDAIQVYGQALQCRITTEDPAQGFAPDFGKIITYRSAAGFGIRLDAGIGGSNSMVEPHYDSLLVKISAWGRDLDDAAQRMGRSLAEFRIRGVKTNIAFLSNVVHHPVFLSGDTHTGFIDQTPALFEFPDRLDRGTKALRALADITINGPPGANGRLVRPAPLLSPKVPQLCTFDDPPISPAYAVFTREGAEGLSRWMRDHKRLLVTDTTFRDAHQSLLATRVRTKDIAAVARQTAHRLPNLFSSEMWGGATFDVCMRFLKEDPWKRMDVLRQKMPGVLFQMLLRGANAVGYTNYPDNVVRAFIQEAAQGIDIFRIFDALNYVPNMELAMDEVNRQGKIVEASICYTGDVMNPLEDKYTVAYYTDLARELEKRGAHIINIKDMAGLLKPYAAKVLIEALKEATDLPIHLHTHDTSGNQVAMYLMAAEAGVDCVDCALSSMAGLTSQPSLNALVSAMREGVPTRSPDLAVEELQELADYWEILREIYYPFESGLKASTTDVYYHEIPGGQYSNLRPRAIQLGLGEQWNVIKTRYHEVDQALGRIVKVTPTSKVVADFAMFLVRNDLTVESLIANHDAGEQYDFPRSVVDFFMGLIGQPHGGFPEKLQEIIIKGQAPLADRAGGHLPDYDWDTADQALRELHRREPTRREQISHALYPKVSTEFAEDLQEFGEYDLLETVHFLFGLQPGEETMVDIEDGKTLVIRMLAIGEVDDNGERVVYFELNGQPRAVKVADESVTTEVVRRTQADKTQPGQIGAAMQGKVFKVNVSNGDMVERGDVLVVTEAMKMETSITTPVGGEVQVVSVAVGDHVDAGDLVVTITPK